MYEPIAGDAPMDTKAIIAEMVKRGEITEDDAAKFAKMFGGGRGRVGKHSIARGLRAKAKQAKRKKK